MREFFGGVIDRLRMARFEHLIKKLEVHRDLLCEDIRHLGYLSSYITNTTQLQEINNEIAARIHYVDQITACLDFAVPTYRTSVAIRAASIQLENIQAATKTVTNLTKDLLLSTTEEVESFGKPDLEKLSKASALLVEAADELKDTRASAQERSDRLIAKLHDLMKDENSNG